MVKYRIEVYGKNSSRKSLDRIIENSNPELPKEGDFLDLTEYFHYNTDRVRLRVKEIKHDKNIPLLKICEESDYLSSHLVVKVHK